MPRVMPVIVPRASGSQCGVPSPTNAGTKCTPPVSGTLRASASRLGRGADQAEAVTQPLHRGAGDEDAPLERVGRLAPRAAGGRGEHALRAGAGTWPPVYTSRNAPVP